MSLHQVNETLLQSWIDTATNFTLFVLAHESEYAHSFVFLFRFWAQFCTDAKRMSHTLSQAALWPQLEKLLDAYVQMRLSNAQQLAGSEDYDPLGNIELLFWELTYFGQLLRFRYDEGDKKLSQLFDKLTTEYNVGVARGAESRRRRACWRRSGWRAAWTRRCASS